MVKILLIIEATKDYLSLFKDIKTITYINDKGEEEEDKLEVDQASFEDVNLSSYSDSGIIVDIKPARNPIYGSRQFEYRTIKPNFVLIRNVTRSVHGYDHRNFLYGLAHSNTPTINSIESMIMNLERPVMYGALLSIQKRLGKDKFPLIQQNYFPNYLQMRFTPEYPIVVKVGHVHSGYGKMLLHKHDSFNDLSSILSLHNDYSTAEHFINGEYDIRIQKIGNNYRAYRRLGSGSTWKTNVGTSIIEDLQITEQYKLWVDEASKLFGGMDIIAIDAIHSNDDNKDYILELNDCSIGLGPSHEDEDMEIIRDLTIQRMKETFSKKFQQHGTLIRDKIDTTSLYKKLEVELINSQNSKMEIEKQLIKSKEQINNLSLINNNLSYQYSIKSRLYLAAGASIGLLSGISIGIYLSSYYLLKKFK